jgi:hypothetical protein
MRDATVRAERRSGLDRRTGSERRQADIDCLAARILRSINRDRRIGEDRRHHRERRKFENVVVQIRALRGALARLAGPRDGSQLHAWPHGGRAFQSP